MGFMITTRRPVVGLKNQSLLMKMVKAKALQHSVLSRSCNHRGIYQLHVLTERVMLITKSATVAVLEPAMEDVKLGLSSTQGFQAFFKYDGAKGYVEDILKQISTMEPKQGLVPTPDKPTAPRFVCAQEDSRRKYPWLHPHADPWMLCKMGATASFYSFSTAYIWICPIFFNNPTKPVDFTGMLCPNVRDNVFTGDDTRFLNFQTYVMIHEMVHFYLQDQSLTGTTYPTEQYRPNDCVALSPLHSLHNPTNYHAYIASR